MFTCVLNKQTNENHLLCFLHYACFIKILTEN